MPSSGMVNNPTTGRPELSHEFEAGRTRLECQTSCAGTWGAKRRELRALHDTQLWTDLAIGTLAVGFRSDLSYYYLGRAAEGLRYYSAAITYYRLSIVVTKTNNHKCNSWINNCDGFMFPENSEARIINLQGKMDLEDRKDPAVADSQIENKLEANLPGSQKEQLWKVKFYIDPVTKDTSCTARNLHNPEIQLTTHELFVPVKHLGELQSIDLQFDDESARIIRSPSEIERRIKAVIIRDAEFKKLQESQRLRVEVLTIGERRFRDNIDLSGMIRTLQTLRSPNCK